MGKERSRRAFIQGSGAALAAGVLGADALRSAAFGATAPGSARGANERVVFGLIGCGGMGRTNMNWFMDRQAQCAAVCDVDTRHLAEAASDVQKKQGKTPEQFKDFRKLLERKDLDAVIIGTPDHWHALPAIYACQAGKDVYCEKPISHNIVEGRAMVKAAQDHKRVVQVGTWQRSTREFVAAVDYVRKGKLGKVTTVRAWTGDGARTGKQRPKTPPAELDYDFWVGPAEKIPYQENRCHGSFRWYWNFAAGMTGDWGVHMIDIGLLAMSPGLDLVMPNEVSSFGGKLAAPDDDRTTPDTLVAIMKCPGFVLHWDTNRKGLSEWQGHGTEFVSEDGRSLVVWRGGVTVRDPQGKELPKPEAPEIEGGFDHVQNFFDCIKSRQRPRSDLASMYQTTTVCHLVNLAYLTGTTIRWDQAKNDLAGNVGRDQLPYRREYRKPWSLPGA